LNSVNPFSRCQPPAAQVGETAADSCNFEESIDPGEGCVVQPEQACLPVCRREDDAPVGVFNFSEIVRGAFRSAYLGYYGFAELAGRGYMSDGLSLALQVGFRSLRLHRIEANVQPANTPSITLVRRGGFTREGYSRRYVKIAGRWRDHERWALLVEDWKAGRKTV